MTGAVDPTTLGVCLGFFLVIAALGFLAGRWRPGDLQDLQEWGLGGRSFGTWVSWFLVGGDYFTAYTLIAAPAVIYGLGGSGYFTVVSLTWVWPVVYLVMPRLWRVCAKHGFTTTAEFVRARYDSPVLSLAVAVTSIVAMLPFIALQLLGMEAVIASLGFAHTELPLFIAFTILALFTYRNGLRAAALLAIVKDVVVYVLVVATVVVVPLKLGSIAAVMEAAGQGLAHRTPPGSLILPEANRLSFLSLALGSAFVPILFPHNITSFLSSASAAAIKRNAMLLPLYSMFMAVFALVGLSAIAVGMPGPANSVVPRMIATSFPSWFAGLCFGAITVSALVPSAVMSIGCANLFTRCLWRRGSRGADETKVAKVFALFVKFGALVFVLVLPARYAIDVQLVGVIWILQIMPAVVGGLYTRWFHPHALLAGMAVGLASGTAMIASTGFTQTLFRFTVFGQSVSIFSGLLSLLLNLAVAIVLTPAMRSTAAGESVIGPEDLAEELSS